MCTVVGQAGEKLKEMLMYLTGIRELWEKTELGEGDGKMHHQRATLSCYGNISLFLDCTNKNQTVNNQSIQSIQHTLINFPRVVSSHSTSLSLDVSPDLQKWQSCVHGQWLERKADWEEMKRCLLCPVLLCWVQQALLSHSEWVFSTDRWLVMAVIELVPGGS